MSRVDELNDRLYNRNSSNVTPQVYFSPRPTPTKYVTMPIVDTRAISKTPIKCQPVFDVNSHFLPGTSAPWSGKIDQIDTETFLLRPMEDFYPTSASDLYRPNQFKPKIDIVQPYPQLFTSVLSGNDGYTNKPLAIPDKQIFNNGTGIKNM